ncbi:hypothetical protein ACHAXA_009920 [Cyclostephanos tholiformis]|uniref:Uncharacterized protein n=1 Tax=Cyclostephanos tholiformis TaxID=382380 RepID=A0ABD3RXX3_9STRA
MTSSPPTQLSESRFVHAFGYHLARKLLGERQTNECILGAYYQRQGDDAATGSADGAFRCLRANWRSNARFPWNIPDSSARESKGGSVDSNLDVETLFVDITFDFIVFPVEIIDGGMTDSYYLLKKDDIRQDFDNGGLKGGDISVDADSIAVSVAVRIGALVAVPATSNITNAANSCNAGSGDAMSIHTYQYKYQRGSKALTAYDLLEHCRSIDIVLEEMDPADVARIIGDAFVEGCSKCSWQVMAKRDSYRPAARCDSTELTDKAIADMSEWAMNDLQWHMKLHHGSLEADGFLPLSSNGCNTSVNLIDRCMLDMILLQSNHGIVGNDYTSVPLLEALAVWKSVDPSIVSAVEKPVGPSSTRKLSPTRNATALLEYVSDVSYPTMENPAPKKGKDTRSEIIGKLKSTVRRPTTSQETALFARGKTTTIGGNRKKPKFRLSES